MRMSAHWAQIHNRNEETMNTDEPKETQGDSTDGQNVEEHHGTINPAVLYDILTATRIAWGA